MSTEIAGALQRLARDYFRGVLPLQQYRAERRRLLADLFEADDVSARRLQGQSVDSRSDRQSAVEETIPVETVTNHARAPVRQERNRSGKLPLLPAVTIILGIAVALGLVMWLTGRDVEAPSVARVELVAPDRAAQKLVAKFLEDNVWTDQHLDTLTRQWGGLSAQQRSAAQEALWYVDFQDEIEDLINELRAVGPLSEDDSASRLAKAFGIQVRQATSDTPGDSGASVVADLGPGSQPAVSTAASTGADEAVETPLTGSAPPTVSEKPAREQAAGEKPAGEKADSEEAAAGQAVGEQPAGETADREKADEAAPRQANSRDGQVSVQPETLAPATATGLDDSGIGPAGPVAGAPGPPLQTPSRVPTGPSPREATASETPGIPAQASPPAETTTVVDAAPPAAAQTGESPGPQTRVCFVGLLNTRRPLCRDRLSDGSAGPWLAVIPAGQFRMGSELADEERPVRTATVSRAFAIGQYEVAYGEYEKFCRATGRKCPAAPWGGAAFPVVDVSWHEAQAYAAWLSEQTGRVYRLPSEAEWEYAARAGGTTRYPAGDEVEIAEVRFGTDSPQANDDRRVNANAFRLYHVVGNVREWVADNWTGNYTGASTDAHDVWADSDGGLRVARGGCYADGPASVRSSSRLALDADTRDKRTGFRVLRELDN